MTVIVWIISIMIMVCLGILIAFIMHSLLMILTSLVGIKIIQMVVMRNNTMPEISQDKASQ